MNAERLHATALAVRADLEATNVPALLSQLAAALRESVESPADPDSQQQAASSREQLIAALTSARANDFSDAWRLSLEELGVWGLLGVNLRDRIEEIFQRNEITLAAAATEIEDLNVQLGGLVERLDQLIAGLAGFQIGAEELDQGEFEVGFLIPRAAVDNELEELGREFVALDSILGPFMELAGEGRPDLEIRSIASSDFQIYLVAAPGIALTLAKVIESLLSSYEKIRNIRAAAFNLQDVDSVPDEAIEPLVAHANERMSIDIDAFAQELVAEVADRLPAGREHELRIEVNRSLRRLARRIDEGYSIEVRAFTPTEEEDEEAAAPDAVADTARAITARQPYMRRMNLTGKPILELPGGEDDEDKDLPGEGES